MTLRTTLAFLLAALVIGWCAGAASCHGSRPKPSPAPASPTPPAQQGQAATQVGDQAQARAAQLDNDLATAKTTIASQAQEIDRLRSLVPDPPQTDPCPELRALSAAQDIQITQQAHALDLCGQRGDALQAEATARGNAATAYQEEARQLRMVVEANPPRPWAVGVSYGTDGQRGLWAERDLWRFRASAEIYHTAAGGLQAGARIGWRF
nr:hypothetical protein [uncultured Holophaga sp.]